MNEELKITALNVKDLLSQDRYRIPIYQRNYDWGEKEAVQLIADIADYASNLNKKSLSYYIGSLVVFERLDEKKDKYYETIDGQQRLTTLTILACALKNWETELDKELVSWLTSINLSYDHRSDADESLSAILNDKVDVIDCLPNMKEVYRVLKKKLQSVISEKGLQIDDFVKYLFEHVIIQRIPVPRDTQLNHYFEIMNSRGEQLEKHEVLKASLMDCLDVPCHPLFNEIWEACSDMESYVQMGFDVKTRDLIFGEKWDEIPSITFDRLLNRYGYLKKENVKKEDDKEENVIKRSIAELIDDAQRNIHYRNPSQSDVSDSADDRFSSIVNFPNFLLHVLKIFVVKEFGIHSSITKDVMLDDKRLIEFFTNTLKKVSDKEGFVKKFIMELLRIRVLFDKYVIKRQIHNGKERWSLKKPKQYGPVNKRKFNYVAAFNTDNSDEEDNGLNRDIRMLEAMFHISAPTMIYKYWLNAILYYVSKEKMDANEFRKSLFSLAQAYMLDRYLTNEPVDFFRIIYENDFRAINDVENAEWSNINQGCRVENFVFNFYDYIVWHEDSQLPRGKKYDSFEFTYRTSVEHFYPQTPMEGYPALTQETGLNDFGNLCLISRGMNSKFSNNMPMAKVANFGKEKDLDLSIKLQEMIEYAKEQDAWGTNEIGEFSKYSRKRIEDALN